MTRWEYKVINYYHTINKDYHTGDVSSDWWSIYPNFGCDLDHSKNHGKCNHITAALDRAGLDGWELAATTSQANLLTYILKRPLH
jgi:hypothetical protein